MKRCPACLFSAFVGATTLIGFLFVNFERKSQSIDTPIASAPEQDQDVLTKKIEKLLSVQTKAWNQGDLVTFMSTYWKSKKLSFSSGGQTTFGWQATLDRYRRGYAPPKKMGKLHFDELKVSAIESKSALVLGDWHLKMDNGSTREGNFSLVMKEMDGKWKIVHDHSSSLEDDKKKDDEKKDDEKPAKKS